MQGCRAGHGFRRHRVDDVNEHVEGETLLVGTRDIVESPQALHARLTVLAIHPNQVAATRSRFRASGGTSGRLEAFVLCELVRTEHRRFRVLGRARLRSRAQCVDPRATDQLRSELERFWPGPIGLFEHLDNPMSPAFLARWPSPIEARRLACSRSSTTGRASQPSRKLRGSRAETRWPAPRRFAGGPGRRGDPDRLVRLVGSP
jgi:hypothetical protein